MRSGGACAASAARHWQRSAFVLTDVTTTDNCGLSAGALPSVEEPVTRGSRSAKISTSLTARPNREECELHRKRHEKTQPMPPLRPEAAYPPPGENQRNNRSGCGAPGTRTAPRSVEAHPAKTTPMVIPRLEEVVERYWLVQRHLHLLCKPERRSPTPDRPVFEPLPKHGITRLGPLQK